MKISFFFKISTQKKKKKNCIYTEAFLQLKMARLDNTHSLMYKI